jgi:polyphosphate kinase
MRRLVEFPSAPFFSRELSWLAFNDRVLEEAADPTNPLLERLRFLVIVSTNLEEFFMVRLASLFRMNDRTADRDGIPLGRLLERIRSWVYDQKQRQAALFEDIRLELAKAGLHIELGPSELAREVFEERVLPHILPMRIPEGSQLPPVKGGKLYMLAHAGKTRALVEIPPAVGRLHIVKSRHVFLVDRLIYTYKDLLFRNQEVKEIFCFKVSRDAEIEIDEDADDPLAEIEAGIRNRDQGAVVRLEVDSQMHSGSVVWLQKELGVNDDRMYQFSLPLDLKDFVRLTDMKSFKKLKHAYPQPKRPAQLPADLPGPKFFQAIAASEILLHHPFVSFDPVVELVRRAAADPKVKRICQTLYRTSGESPILEALKLAAQAGKQVTALVEIKARFDEANNIRWARALEKAGARVIYGTPEIKIHAKLTLVEREEGRGRKGYVHISTGNYHPRTARYYTDLGLITTSANFVEEARTLFDTFEKMDEAEDWDLLSQPERFANRFKTWVVAPTALHERIIGWIKNETENARAGKPSGIRAKMNGLVEGRVIEALYEASQAGVRVDLIIRGMCRLRPGVPGLSENIRVRSIVDKYLEHSRVFIFENGGDRKIWLSSADWMPRNFFKRIELAVPVQNEAMKAWIIDEFWETYIRDNVRARECTPEGEYVRVLPWGQPDVRAQFHFEKTEMPSYGKPAPKLRPERPSPSAPSPVGSLESPSQAEPPTLEGAPAPSTQRKPNPGKS